MKTLAAPLWERAWGAPSLSAFAVGDECATVATYHQSHADVYEAATGKHAASLTGHSDVITSIKIAEDGIWTSSDDGAVRLWDPQGRPQRAFQPHGGPYPRIGHLDVDGELGCSTAGDYTTRVWQRDTGVEVMAVPRRDIWGAALRLSQNRLITGRPGKDLGSYGLHVVDIGTQKTIVDESARGLGFTDNPIHLKYIDLRGRTAAFCWLSEHASVHDLRDFRCAVTLKAGLRRNFESGGAQCNEFRPVSSIRFADDNKVLTTCLDVKVWDLRHPAAPVATYDGPWCAAEVEAGTLMTASNHSVAAWDASQNL